MNTSFKYSTAAAALLGASAAMAYQPTSMTDGDIVIFAAGATASEQALFDAVTNLCLPSPAPSCFVSSGSVGNASDCLDSSNTISGGYFTVACTTDGSRISGLGGTRRLLFHKTGGGGSAWGVQPVAAAGTPNAVDVGFMDASTSSTNCSNSSNYEVCTFTFDPVTDAALDDVFLAEPNVGSSDEEPAIFGAPLNTPSAQDFDLNGLPEPLPNANLATLSPSGAGDLPFGTVVNDDFYQILQAAQFPAGHPDFADCNPAGASYGSIANINDNANSEKCMPSLTEQEIASLFASGRGVNSLDDLTAESPFGSGTQVPVTSLIPAGVTVTDNTIQICRRVQGSGTQAQEQIQMFNYPCDRDAADGSIDVKFPAVASFLDPSVTENRGSSDLSRCLLAYQTGTVQGATDPGGAQRAAIGLQATTRNDTFSRQFKFVKLSGAAPTIENVHAGDYPQFFTQSFQYKPGVLPAEGVLVFNQLVDNQNNPTVLTGSGFTETHGWGDAGWLATPSATNPPSAVLNKSAPVNAWRRVSNAGVPNSCAKPTAYEPNDVDVIVGPAFCSSGNGTCQ